MSPRAQIAMSAEEAAQFLAEQPTVTCATLGRDGRPHLMPLWYVLRAGELWAWTFAKSQKVRNLERDPSCTLQVETGVVYGELRGIMLRCGARIHRDTEMVQALGFEIMDRYYRTPGFAAPRSRGEGGSASAEPSAARADEGSAAAALDPAVEAMVRRQAPKRVALQFVEDGPRASWDFRKLG